MAQTTFSHQFTQRWLAQPAKVKNAIVRELDDIVRLLDDETDLDTFDFSIPDLNQYIEEAYQEYAADRASALSAEKLRTLATSSKANVDPVVLEDDNIEAFESAESYENKKAISELNNSEMLISNTEESMSHLVSGSKTSNSDKTIETSNNLHDSSSAHLETNDIPNSPNEPHIDKQQDSQVVQKTDVESTHSEPVLTTVLKDDNQDASNDNKSNYAKAQPNVESNEVLLQAVDISELEARIEDYLSEEMTNMSFNIKSWLREQVKTLQDKQDK